MASVASIQGFGVSVHVYQYGGSGSHQLSLRRRIGMVVSMGVGSTLRAAAWTGVRFGLNHLGSFANMVLEGEEDAKNVGVEW